MTTAQEVFNIAMDLIDERLETGIISTSDTAAYRVKTPSILTILQAELLKEGDQFKTYAFSQSPVTNTLGSQFNVRAFEGEDLIFECNGPVRSYYFEADKTGTAYVEDFNGAWNTLATVPLSGTDFAAYKGTVTPSSGATKARLRFTGSYFYRTVNRALYAVSVASSGDVPVYLPWMPITLPSDFKRLVEIVDETTGLYLRDTWYKWEGRKNLFINRNYSGKIRVVYRPVPAIVANLNDALQVDDVTAVTIMPYGLACQLVIEENSDMASFFNGRYNDLKATAGKAPPSSFDQTTDVYGGFGYG